MVWLCIHMYVLCLMLYLILNNTIHGVEPRWREKRDKRQGCKYFNASCVTFFTFEIDAAGKYRSPKKRLLKVFHSTMLSV